MFEKKFILITLLITVFVLVGGIGLVNSNRGINNTTVQASFQSGGKVEIEQTSIDWGKIAFRGGNKEAFFRIKNTGDSVLKLRNIKTSCHCTKAEVNINGQISPSFGMGGITSWIGEIQPNSEAELKIIFDPMYHGPQGIGPIERYVKVETSDPGKSYIEFMVKGVVEKI